MRRLPPLAAVRVFEAAARHESFTTAAAELGMTQAAVSYQMRVLEERLGLPLFQRVKRRVTLTEAGRRAAPAVSKAFDGIAEAFAGLVDAGRGVLAISTAQTFASTWLAARLGRFQLSHPELAVRLSTDTRLVDFAADPFDCAVRIGQGSWPGLRAHFLFRWSLTPMCSPGYRDAAGLDAPERLLQARWISPEDEWWSPWLREAGVDLPAETGASGRTGGLDSQISEAGAAMAGHGVALMTPLFWANELASGRLVQPFPTLFYPGPSYWLVYPEASRSAPKLRAFRDWLLAEVAEMARAGPAETFDPALAG